MLIDACCTKISLINSGVTAQNFTKFVLNVNQFIALLTHPSAFRYSDIFWNTSRKMKVGGPISTILLQKCQCDVTVERSIATQKVAGSNLGQSTSR